MSKSQMQHSFSNVPTQNIPRSTFQRNFNVKTTFDSDGLVPVLVDDIIPGDTFNVGCNFVVDLTSPTLVGLKDNIYVDTFFFFVPYRLIWDQWEKFCGAQTDPGDSIDFTIPLAGSSNNIGIGDVGDYMGIPSGFIETAVDVSALPSRAYRLIWNEWFRDQNLQDSLVVETDNGPDTVGGDGYMAGGLLKRGKRHDYFASSLPFPQKGTAVTLPLTQNANIRTAASAGGNVGIYSDGEAAYRLLDTGASWGDVSVSVSTAEANKLYADLVGVGASTINDIRLAFQTQRLLEVDARSGTRYVETLLAHWGVTVPDFRLQRPEYLGGGSTRVNFSEVAQTTFQGTQTLEDAKGARSSIGRANGTHGFSKSFVEHGVVIGLVNVRGEQSYSQGIDRYWHKSTRYDFYYKELALIGEQSVLNKEIFFANDANDDLVFGYQERYAEYRYKNSLLTGLMRVDAASSLATYHLSEDFASLPTLGATFIESNLEAPLDRAISVPSQPQFIGDFFFSMRCARPLPMFGVPGNLDRM